MFPATIFQLNLKMLTEKCQCQYVSFIFVALVPLVPVQGLTWLQQPNRSVQYKASAIQEVHNQKAPKPSRQG